MISPGPLLGRGQPRLFLRLEAGRNGRRIGKIPAIAAAHWRRASNDVWVDVAVQEFVEMPHTVFGR